ncbi:MAG: RidA family protein [Candidatus Dadabacteria bacterium]|nr:RidA family protein [Candidatus Dadabacteria bacterium]NIQ16325.1 RidA family protein [Candidatus Dadabacteria bacterium]
MIEIENKLKELGIELNNTPIPLGSYVPAKISGNLIFVSGQLPIMDGKLVFEGKVDSDITVEQGYDAARISAINCLSVIKFAIGDFSKLNKIVKVTGYVSSSMGFTRQANVVNGASDLFAEVLGEDGKHSRVAVGVYELPLNSPVELEVVAEISSDYSY